jgi:hypothetical protein
LTQSRNCAQNQITGETAMLRQQRPRSLSAIAREPRYEKQYGQSNGSNAVGPDCTTACRPRKHQGFKEWHEFIRPKWSRQPECQTQLDNDAQLQIIHGKDSNVEIPFIGT